MSAALLISLLAVVTAVDARLVPSPGRRGDVLRIQADQSAIGTGVVIAIEPDPATWGMATLTVDHEEMPGLMPAMEMMYKVESPELLSGVTPGGRVQFTIRTGDFTITAIEVLSAE